MRKGNTSKAVAAFLLASALIAVPVSSASAATGYPVNGSFQPNGSTVHYPTFRYHVSGLANLGISYLELCGGANAYGLRNRTGSQITDTIRYTAASTRTFVNASNHTNVTPTDYYAINGHNVAGGFCGDEDLVWRGTLTL